MSRWSGNFEDLEITIRNVLSADTCYPPQRSQWSMDNPTLGHCAIVSLIIQDLFGGRIAKVEKLHHYFNVIGGDVVDFTKDQFDKNIYCTEPFSFVDRQLLLSNEDTKRRYEILKSKL